MEISVNIQTGLDLVEQYFLNLGMQRNRLEHLWAHTFLGLRGHSSEKLRGDAVAAARTPLSSFAMFWGILVTTFILKLPLFLTTLFSSLIPVRQRNSSGNRRTCQNSHCPLTRKQNKTNYKVPVQHRASLTGHLSRKKWVSLQWGIILSHPPHDSSAGRWPCQLNP